MANPSKAKGTKGENEVKAILEGWGYAVQRTAPGSKYDLRAVPYGAEYEDAPPLHVLATRPDRGRWLFTFDPAELSQGSEYRQWLVEVKRYARFSLHTIFEGKFT
jgi:hypothetical protein